MAAVRPFHAFHLIVQLIKAFPFKERLPELRVVLLTISETHNESRGVRHPQFGYQRLPAKLKEITLGKGLWLSHYVFRTTTARPVRVRKTGLGLLPLSRRFSLQFLHLMKKRLHCYVGKLLTPPLLVIKRLARHRGQKP